MKKLKARELMWMTLPVVLIGSVAWWRVKLPVEERPPEDVSNGKPRVLIGQWHELKPSAFDVYRGYERKYEVSLWSAGKFPPLVPRKGARSLRVSRDISPQYPVPDVVFKSGGKWQKLPSSFKNPSVLLEFSPHSETLEERLRVPLLVRLPSQASSSEARLRGRLNLVVYDRELSSLPAGATTDDIIGEHDLVSPLVDRAILQVGQKRQTPSIVRVSPLSLNSLARSKFQNQSGLSLHLEAQCDSSFPLSAPFSVRLHRGRLLDKQGHEVAHCELYESSVDDHLIKIEPSFSAFSASGKAAAKALTFQGALSVNGSWPIEINVLVPASVSSTAIPIRSSLRFER